MAPFFSVIVPVYNVEAYLPACVDSILGQTFGSFELFLVDDGSPDGCPAICDGYAQKDSRVRVIHQPNAGLAMARKSGLRLAAGEYVCFVDSDDWVEPFWLETVEQLVRANDRPDIVLFEHRRDAGETEDPIRARPGYYDKARLEAEVYPYMVCDLRRRPFGQQLTPAFAWSRACRRQLLLDHYIPDDVPITLFEDIAMSYECMYFARSMVITDRPLYVYRRRGGSILTAARPRYFSEIQTCFDYLRSRLGGRDDRLDRQINAAYLYRVMGGFVRELALQGGNALRTARTVRAGLGRTDAVGSLSFAGLPTDMRLFLLLLKCRLYLPAVLAVRLRT